MKIDIKVDQDYRGIPDYCRINVQFGECPATSWSLYSPDDREFSYENVDDFLEVLRQLVEKIENMTRIRIEGNILVTLADVDAAHDFPSLRKAALKRVKGK